MKDAEDQEKTYREDFPVRHWPRSYVDQVLDETGFTLDADLKDQFNFTGSDYLLLKRPG